jgi:hypothetical protein
VDRESALIGRTGRSCFVGEVTGRLFRAKTAPRPLFAPPYSYRVQIDFVYRVFSVMSLGIGDGAKKLTKKEAN